MIGRFTGLLIIFLLGLVGFSQAQLTIERQVIGTTGHYGQVGPMSISYTMGELITKTAITTNGTLILTQGFQQPDTAGNLVSIDQPIAFPVEYIIYPNPTTGVLKVELTSDKSATVVMDVYDMRGRKTSVPIQKLRLLERKRLFLILKR